MTKLATLAGLMLCTTAASADIRIAHVYGKTGALEAYAEQSHIGLMLGLEYATDGTMEIDGEPIEVLEFDTQLDPAIGRAALAEAYGDADAHIAVGPVSSGVALAMLPVAEEYERILIVEPAVADSITGENWNRYIFRTGRNSSQDAISNAVALGGEDVAIATLAQDYAFGRDGVAAFREALDGTGAEIVHEEYVPTDTTDFTAAAERIFQAMEGVEAEDKKLFIIWAGGGNPMSAINAMDPSRFDVEIATGGNILAALTAYKELPGLEGATYYYYEIPQNPVNDWLVEQHFDRYDSPPDFFTAGGMAAGIAVVEAIREAGGAVDTEALIEAMEGMEWETPKGTMRFRPEDHQALQSMYHFTTEVQEGKDYGVPVLVRELGIDDMDIPVRNQ
ncbi:branched-chain amino acid ABC transporter, periplasmic branched-chain amino acid-binding protein [Oceanicola granulosus HTCC2516]|uniref:Branched-chain amino acid ABC transporter, periplasmic branched-chain amino acid-binding protein n=1 Tax=Oceanicola granulosus (strain ATCC BAA-861 / DSM 15982 / KCTC 12143 / HTCC2516) TaxID=314256 RepID=Q2CEZ5_OCEGH|nr:substrate-binding domain-containing protein [Oceanicola granulosus]EAR51215.1 branched-chain amino acid ABC transporter, periplasmic branched-chain amino acid-binding protein [Oceanicola granulosus HTCC2516]